MLYMDFKNVCFYGDRDSGKTTSLIEIFRRLYNHNKNLAVLDSTVEHGQKSLINKLYNKYKCRFYTSPDEKDILNTDEIEYILNNQFDFGPIFPYITREEFEQYDTVNFDLSKYPEESHKVEKTESKKKRMYFQNLSNQILLKLSSIHNINKYLYVLMDEIDWNKQTLDIVKKTENLKTFSSFHEEPKNLDFDLKIDLNERKIC